jgi:hypothetical protein
VDLGVSRQHLADPTDGQMQQQQGVRDIMLLLLLLLLMRVM